MSAVLDLSRIQPAFADPVRDSQAAFRHMMEATARPGSHADLGPIVEPPAGLAVAAAATALTLFDFETPVWLDPALREGDAEAWLRFHCGCPLTGDPATAAFALVADPLQAPPLSAFDIGDAKYPDRSTTVILQASGLSGGAPVILSGPGVKDRTEFAPSGLPEGFWAQVQENNSKFQRGVDLLFAAGSALVALPRSMRVQIPGDR